MSTRCLALPVCCAVLVLVLMGTGCTTTSIGDVAYRNGTIAVSLANTGEPGDAFVQVTVYEIKDLHQEKIAVLQTPVTLQRGQNRVLVPVTLPPGSYKLYVYILKPDERQTATIKDIIVE
jgi:hypothetical protein